MVKGRVLTMIDCIERDKVLEFIKESIKEAEAEYIKSECTCTDDFIDGWVSGLQDIENDVSKNIPSANVRPERRGHIIWRKRHRGGFRTAKCLSDFGNCIFTPTCKHIAKIDERCIIDEPYCSECSKLLGDSLNFCPNCGAKMGVE